MATNRIETLDPALLRPGRIDRKIEFPLPDSKTKRRIFNIHVSRMSLADDVNLEEFVMSKDELSGADIKAMCTEAGLLALRERRMKVRLSYSLVHLHFDALFLTSIFISSAVDHARRLQEGQGQSAVQEARRRPRGLVPLSLAACCACGQNCRLHPH